MSKKGRTNKPTPGAKKPSSKKSSSKRQSAPQSNSSNRSRTTPSITQGTSTSSRVSKPGNKRPHRSSHSSNDPNSDAERPARRARTAESLSPPRLHSQNPGSGAADDPQEWNTDKDNDQEVSSQPSDSDEAEDVEGKGKHPKSAKDKAKQRLEYEAAQEKAALIDLGRAVQRAVVAWTPLHAVFYEGLIRVTTYLSRNSISDNQPLSPEDIGIPGARDLREVELDDMHATMANYERDRIYSLFCKIYRMSQKLSMKIVEAGSRFNKLVGYVSSGANAARSTDLRAVRVMVMDWGGLKRVAKAGRGFHQPFTAALLLPCDQTSSDQDLIEAFEKDERLAFPQYAEPPRFLYGGDLSKPVELDSANSIILRNPYLFAAWCRVYQSDDSAIDMFTEAGQGDLTTLTPTADPELVQQRGTGGSRSVGNATGIKSTTPHTVGYAACLLRAALSSDEKLSGEVDNPEVTYDYSALYDEVVQTLTVTGNPVTDSAVKSILEWWDRHAFPRNYLRGPRARTRLTMQERLAVEAQATTAVSSVPRDGVRDAIRSESAVEATNRGQALSSSESTNRDTLHRRGRTNDDEESIDGGEIGQGVLAPANGPSRAGSVDVAIP